MKYSVLRVIGGLIVAALCQGCSDSESTGGQRMAVNLLLHPRQEVFSPATDIVIDVRVENTSGETVRVPDPSMPGSRQPRFTLRSPDGKEVTFVPADGRGVSPTAASPVIDIAPGETAEGDLSLRNYAKMDQEGEYQISAVLEFEGMKVSTQSARFRVESTPILDVAAFWAHSPDGESGTGLVTLARAGRLGTVVVLEKDPRNGELFPLEVQGGPQIESGKRVIGWFANYDVAFDPVRWMLAATDTGLVAATNLSSKAVVTTAGKPIGFWTNGLVTPNGISIAAIASGPEPELFWISGTAPEGEPRLEAPRRIAQYNGVVTAAAATLAPSDGRAVVAATIASGADTRLVVSMVTDGAARSTKEYRVEGLGNSRAVAAGWSSRDEIKVIVLGSDASRKVRMAELSLHPDLSAVAPPRVSGALDIEEATQARILVLERTAGTLAKAAVVTSAAGVFGIDSDNKVRRIDSPVTGSYVVLPGRSRWYVIWPMDSMLQSSSF